jgi:hypothetical protein
MMSDGKDGSPHISRRLALTRTALSLGIAAAGMAVTRADAQQKLAQDVAKYQDQPKGQQSCAGCVNFQPPNACKFVQGTISPNGWCQLFSPKT